MKINVRIEEITDLILAVTVGSATFLFGIMLYKHFNPFAFIGIEEKVLHFLVPLGLLTFILHFPYTKVASKFGQSWDFLKVRKKWWLTPIVMFLLLLSLLLVLAQGSAVAPFIYAIF